MKPRLLAACQSIKVRIQQLAATRTILSGCLPRRGQSRDYYRNREHLDAHRPKWGYPQYWKNLSEDQIQEMRRIQSLLNELGPMLVAKGMLAP